MKKLAVVAHENDNVATTVRSLPKGEKVLIDVLGKEISVVLKEDIPFGHKFAIKKIEKDTKIVKYGEIIGHATEDIEVGCHVHVQNVVSDRGRGDLEVDQ